MSTTEREAAASTRDVARGGLANLAGAGYSGLASFVITALVARIATTDDAGTYFSAVSILLICISLVELGVPVGYVYFLSRHRALGQASRFRAVLSAGAVPMLIVGALLVACGLIFRETLGELLLGDAVPTRASIVAILASCLLIAVSADAALGATRGLGVMRPTVVADKFVNPTVQLLALLLIALAGWTGSEELVWTRAVGFLAMAALSLPWLVRLLNHVSPRQGQTIRQVWRPDAETYREFWRFTWPRAFGQIAQVGIQRVDIILVALWLSPTEAAVYAAASRFLIFGQLAANAIGTAVQPRISALAATSDTGALKALYRTSTAWVMFATWPFYLTFVVQADSLMRLFGSEYARGALVLQILSAAMLIATACGAVDAVLLMAGKSTWTMINAWMALIINVGLNIWLTPELGILGAALAWVAAICANNVVPLIQAKVGIGVHPYGRITLLAAVVPASLFGFAPWLVKSSGGSVLVTLGTLAAASVVYATLLWRWRRALGMAGLLRRTRPLDS